ncbi:MAG TPA: S-layer homology domain-containing protein [Candidatus Ornithomonoglobus intestinigallinarum]|uniref:S-layer homology domain-containing protein n=1 Tax=Candidatus Ornithomonoglobus intestinigallinarum TaxID=2840894 RepID=A0A9D1KQI4_9FIRM|nr:S-layer homology domain-containing protein [Candidatus Ornithomonoglobus intestinigallinarum]
MFRNSKKLKSIFSVLAATAAAFNIAVSALAADGAEASGEVITADNEYYGLLAAISDMENYIEYDNEPVTRADFVRSFISVIDMEHMSGTALSFEDVDPSSEMYDALSAAVGMGLISDSDSFRPDDAITLNEVYKICVSACGYALSAEMSGGYPQGYIAAASELRLADGISSTDSVSGVDAYRIIFNTLDADYYYRTADGYEKGSGDVLEAYRDITEIRGVVTSNGTASCGSYEAAAEEPSSLEGTIGIDYVKYISDLNYDLYLGYSVKAYTTYNEYDEAEIVYVCPEKDNDVISLASYNIEYTRGYIETLDGANERYTLNSSAEVIYNGRADYDYSLDLLNDVNGTVTLVDNDNDRKYDYIIIDDYYYMEVASYDKEELVIRDTRSADKQITLDDSVSFSVYSEEEADYTELSSITQGSMLAVRRSNDEKVVDIIILGRILSGTVDSYTDELITVNGADYHMSDYFAENYLNGLGAGKNADFYLGVNDEIAALSYIDTPIEYGYLTLAYLEDNDEEMGVKIFTERGEHMRYSCASKMTVDGTSMTETEAYAAITSKGARQLIRYGLNDEGELKTVDTSETSSTYLDDSRPLNEYNNLTKHSFAASYYYRVSTFYPYFNIQNTVIFRAPNNADDTSGYAIGYSFADGNIADGTIEPYNVGLDGTADALVVYADNNDAAINRVSPSIILVEKVYEELAPDGEIKTKISGWESGTFKEHYLKNGIEILKDRAPAEIKPGDIVRFTETNDEITAAVVEFIGEELRPNTGDNLGYFNIRSTDCHYQVGSVYSFEGQWALISNTRGEADYNYDTANLINVKIPDSIAVYNSTIGVIRTGTRDDIKTYMNSGSEASYILVKQYYGTSNFCVIYEK